MKKVPRGVLVKCEQCGEEVRGKNMLKEHIKFYHPKIKAQKPTQKAGKGSKGYQTPKDWVQASSTRVSTNASMVSRGAKSQNLEDVRTREAKRKSLEDPFFSNFLPASTSGQSTSASGDVSRGARKQIMVDPFFANININPVPPTPDQSTTCHPVLSVMSSEIMIFSRFGFSCSVLIHLFSYPQLFL